MLSYLQAAALRQSRPTPPSTPARSTTAPSHPARVGLVAALAVLLLLGCVIGITVL